MKRSPNGSAPDGGAAPGAAEYDFLPLRLPKDVSRVSAAMRLQIEAEFGGWELSRVRLYTDGSRRILLRRRRTKTTSMLPEPSTTRG